MGPAKVRKRPGIRKSKRKCSSSYLVPRVEEPVGGPSARITGRYGVRVCICAPYPIHGVARLDGNRVGIKDVLEVRRADHHGDRGSRCCPAGGQEQYDQPGNKELSARITGVAMGINPILSCFGICFHVGSVLSSRVIICRSLWAFALCVLVLSCNFSVILPSNEINKKS